MKRNSIGGLLLGLLALLFIDSNLHAQFYRSEKYDAYLRNSPSIIKILKPLSQALCKSTVEIEQDGKVICLGTIVSSDGYIITKASELRKELKVRLADKRSLPAKVVGEEYDFDIALLKVDAQNLQPVTFDEGKNLDVGNWLISTTSISSDNLAVGVLSVKSRKMTMNDYPPPKRTGYLGILFSPMSKEGGVAINEVFPKSAADKAGLKKGDVIYAIGGRQITGEKSLLMALLHYRIGEEIPVEFLRDDEEMSVVVTLAPKTNEMKSNDDRALFQNGFHKDLSNVNIGFPVAFQHDTNLRAKQIGGPIINLAGKVVGINISSAGRVDSYAIPSEEILKLLPKLKSGKLLPQKYALKDSKKVKKLKEDRPVSAQK